MNKRRQTKGRKKADLHIGIPRDLLAKAHKVIPNLSAFVQDMLERELAGEFNQLKIDEAEKKLELLKSQQSQIQTKKQEQKILSDANLKEILDEQQAESRAWREKDRKKPREG